MGRRRELAQLGLLCDAAVEERHPQLVSIVAPAGMGKTRLLEEFLAQTRFRRGLARSPPRAACHMGRLSPTGRCVACWMSCSVSSSRLERVAGVFAARAYDPEQTQSGWRDSCWPLWALRRKNTPSARAPSTPGGCSSRRWREQAPRIVVFEDLHWASESLLDLVEYIMRPRTQAALLIVATSRPELLDRRPLWGGGRQNFTALTLAPLSDTEIRIAARQGRAQVLTLGA